MARAKPRSGKRPSLLLLLSFAVVLAGGAALVLPASSIRPAPDVEFALLDGAAVRLHALRGRPVLVSFWATTCRACVAELPELVALYRDLHPRGFEVIGVAMPYDPPNQVQRFVRAHQVPYPIALDVQGLVARAFDDVRFTPTTFLLDRDGNIVLTQVGALDTARVRRIILRELEAAPRG